MPTRVTPAAVRRSATCRQPIAVFSTCQHVVLPSIAMSSLSLEVSIPAVFVLVFLIFLEPCLVNANQVFRQPYGSGEEADAILLHESHSGSGWARSDRQPPDQVRHPGRAFLAELPKHKHTWLIQGWAKAPFAPCPRGLMTVPHDMNRVGTLRFAHPCMGLFLSSTFRC